MPPQTVFDEDGDHSDPVTGDGITDVGVGAALRPSKIDRMGPNPQAALREAASRRRLAELGFGTPTTFSKGEVIWLHDAPSDYALYVTRGVLKKRAPWQATVGMALIFPCESAGMDCVLTQPRRLGDLEAFTDAEAILLTAEELRRCTQGGGEAGWLVMQQLALSTRLGVRRVAAMVGGAVAERLARVFMLTCKRAGVRCGVGWRINLPITQADLAELVGCRRETVARTLGLWSAQGIVDMDRSGILIMDPGRLRRVAGAAD